MARPEKSLLRFVCLAIGIGAVFGVLLATVHLESSALACAYRIRELREHEARLRNANDVLRADVAFRKKHDVLGARVDELELIEDVPAQRVALQPTTGRVREIGAD